MLVWKEFGPLRTPASTRVVAPGYLGNLCSVSADISSFLPGSGVEGSLRAALTQGVRAAPASRILQEVSCVWCGHRA